MAAEFEAGILVEALKWIRETIGSIKEKLIEICVLFPEYQYLLTIPGFGSDVSAILLAAIGDPFRFESGSQFLKTAGWDLSANRSGKRSDSVTPVISKRGKSDLRYALYQAALIASTRDRRFTIGL
jgi:transposase